MGAGTVANLSSDDLGSHYFTNRAASTRARIVDAVARIAPNEVPVGAADVVAITCRHATDPVLVVHLVNCARLLSPDFSQADDVPFETSGGTGFFQVPRLEFCGAPGHRPRARVRLRIGRALTSPLVPPTRPEAYTPVGPTAARAPVATAEETRRGSGRPADGRCLVPPFDSTRADRRRFSAPGRALVWLALLLVPAGSNGQDVRDVATDGPVANLTALDTLLDSTYRIDIETIAVVLDWYPATGWVDGTARLEFRLRPGQSRAAFNFTPFVTARSTISRLELDGHALSPQSDFDVRTISVPGTRQPFVEIQSALDPAVLHVLTVEYHLQVPAVYPRFSSEVNDLRGQGNESAWPTLNTPHELARHVLTLRVHDRQAFRFVGTGRTGFRQDGDVQEWVLDTQRAVASYSVMFVLLPAVDTQYQEWIIDGVPVRVLAYEGVDFAEARARLESWLPELRRRFGPFPALHGLSIFLYNDTGGGMEYYGGTISSLAALRHEVLHSYFGCSVVLRTYPDTWLDEAITTWFEQTTRGQGHQALAATYRGNWVGARSPVSVGFSVLAYTDGASIMQDIADRLGGTDRMTDFLRSVVQTRTFAPFTTMDFVGYLQDFSGLDLRPRFLDWLYAGREPTALTGAPLSPLADRKVLDLNPPWIRRNGGR